MTVSKIANLQKELKCESLNGNRSCPGSSAQIPVFSGLCDDRNEQCANCSALRNRKSLFTND